MNNDIPRDASRSPIQLTPATTALARTVNGSISSSATITFNTSTTILRCYAITQDVYLKWGTTAASSSNFDEVIPAGQIVDLIVPFNVASAPNVRYTACTVIERTPSATITVIEK